MATIKDLKQQASDLGLTSEYVKAFGKLSAKKTWVDAIAAYEQQQQTEVEETTTPQPEPTPVVVNDETDDVWVLTPEPNNAVEVVVNYAPITYQLCLPAAFEAEAVTLQVTTDAVHLTPTLDTPQPQNIPTLAVVLIVAVMVLVGQVIAATKPIVGYLYENARSAITRKRNEHRRRQHWYNELRQLMTS